MGATSFIESLAYLKTKQQKDGSFLSYASPDSFFLRDALVFHSIFSTSLILSCLDVLPDSTLKNQIQKRAAAFLLAQKSDSWTFNYWARDSQEAKISPYPDDLDDTFCALSALYLYDRHLITGKVLADVVHLLTTLEAGEGGPYRTWVVSKESVAVWKDVDLAVNSNIAYFLSLQDIILPKITRFIESSVLRGAYSSAYYPTHFSLIYFIARAYHGSKTEEIKNFLLRHRKADFSWGNSLNTALAVSSLLRLGVEQSIVAKSVGYLKDFSAYPFYISVNPKKDKKFYAGSAALTAAFCLEALALFDRNKSTKLAPLAQQGDDKDIVAAVRKRFRNVSPEISLQADSLIKQLRKADTKKQITLLPYYFQACLGNRGENIPDNFLLTLGKASLFGWIAYTIYDDFLDDEGDPKQLTVANVSLRELTLLFTHLFLDKPEWQTLFQQSMDRIEQANAWEVHYCRRKDALPEWGDYTKLADRSFGHALGCLAILFFLGFSKKSPEVKMLCTFFQHFLIAKQLNDDAHDWQEDLKKGRLTPVVTLLLKKSSNHKKNTLQKIFWYGVMPIVCRDILDHVALARKALSKNAAITNPSFLETLLSTHEKAAQKALKEQKMTVEFLKEY